MNAELSLGNYYQQQPSYAKPKPTVSFKEIAMRYIYHWPLFVVFIIASLAGGFIYALYSKPVYVVNAKLLIRDPESKTKEEIALKQLNQTEEPKGVETELQMLKSRPIIEHIVNDLQLWVNYEQKGAYFNQNLYANSPVKFALLKSGKPLANQVITVIINSTDKFSVKKSDGSVSNPFSFNQILTSDFGTWKLDATAVAKNYIGKTVLITLQNPNNVIGAYQAKISAINLDKTVPIVNLSIEDVVPQRGKDILNELIEQYHIAAAIEKNKLQKNTLDFINNRLALLSGELQGVEINVENFKSSRGINDIESDSKAYFDNYQTNDKTINEVNLQLQVIDGIEKYVNADNGYDNPPVTIGITDGALSDLVSKLTQLQLDRNKLLASVPEGNPMFATIDKQIKSTRDILKGHVAGIKANLLTMKKQKVGVNTKFESTIKSVPGQERQLDNIKRQQSIKENLYVYLLQKREEIGLDYASTIPNASIIEAANSSGMKSSKTSMIMAMSLILGFVFPIGLLYGRDVLNNTITSKNELINATNAPIIAEIMYDDESTPEMILSKTRYVQGEQFRNLRTKINYLNKNNAKGRVTMLTSSVASEGKSFITTNLAIILAASGRKTIILELDMRLPKISKLLKINVDHPGVSTFLNNKCSLTSTIQKTSVHPNLDVIGTGQVPNNPSELIESENMVLMIELLKMDYDEILIDTPPIHLVTDAMILAPLSDTTLYVVRQGHTPKTELEFIDMTYNEGKLPNMNIVFNGIQKMGRYSYGYKYDYTYYATVTPKSFKASFKDFLKRF